MSWFVAAMLAVLPVQNASEYLEQLLEGTECAGCSQATLSESPNVRVFISFSVPMATWKEFSLPLQKVNGAFVLRGIPDNSFVSLAQKIKELREAGVLAPIDIDPAAFEGIEMVPAIVVGADRVTGNIRLDAALRLFAEKGDAKERAAQYLRDIES